MIVSPRIAFLLCFLASCVLTQPAAVNYQDQLADFLTDLGARAQATLALREVRRAAIVSPPLSTVRRLAAPRPRLFSLLARVHTPSRPSRASSSRAPLSPLPSPLARRPSSLARAPSPLAPRPSPLLAPRPSPLPLTC